MQKPSWDKPTKVAGMWTRGGRRQSTREVDREDVLRGQRPLPASPTSTDHATHKTMHSVRSKESSTLDLKLPTSSTGTDRTPPITPLFPTKPTIVPPKSFKTASREKFEEGLKEKLRDNVSWEKPPPTPAGAPMGKRIRPRIPVELDDTGEVVQPPRRDVWPFPVRGPRPGPRGSGPGQRGPVPGPLGSGPAQSGPGSARDVARRVEETTREFREWAREAADRTVEKSEAGRRAHLAQRSAALALANKSGGAPKSKEPSKQDFANDAFSVQPVTIQEMPKPSPRHRALKKDKGKDVKAQIQAVFKAMPSLEEKNAEKEAAKQTDSRVVIRITSPQKSSRPASDADHSSIASSLSPLSSPARSHTPDSPHVLSEDEERIPADVPRTLAQILEEFDLGSRPTPDKVNTEAARVIPSTPMAEPPPKRPVSRGGTEDSPRRILMHPITPAKVQEVTKSVEGPVRSRPVSARRVDDESPQVIRDSMRVLEESRRVLRGAPRWQEFYNKTEEGPEATIERVLAERQEEKLQTVIESPPPFESPRGETSPRKAQRASPRRKSGEAKPRTPSVRSKPASPIPGFPTKPGIPRPAPSPRGARTRAESPRRPSGSYSPKKKSTERNSPLASPKDVKKPQVSDTDEVEIHEVDPEVVMMVPQGSTSLAIVPEIASALVVEKDISSKSAGIDIFGQGTRTFVRTGPSRETSKSPDIIPSASPDPSSGRVIRRGGPQAMEAWMEAGRAQGDLTSAVVLEETPRDSQTINTDQGGGETVEVHEDQIRLSKPLDDQEYSGEEEEVEVKKRGKPKWFKEYGLGLDDSETEFSEEVSEEMTEPDIEKQMSHILSRGEPSIIKGESGTSVEIEEKSAEGSVCRSAEEDSTKQEAESIDIVMASTVPLVQADHVLEPVSDLKLPTEDTTQYSDYLKTSVGRYLVRGLVQVLVYKPEDPIDYLAHWLHAQRDCEDRASAVLDTRSRLQELRNITNMERKQATVMEQAVSHLATADPACMDPDMIGFEEEQSETDFNFELNQYSMPVPV